MGIHLDWGWKGKYKEQNEEVWWISKKKNEKKSCAEKSGFSQYIEFDAKSEEFENVII